MMETPIPDAGRRRGRPRRTHATDGPRPRGPRSRPRQEPRAAGEDGGGNRLQAPRRTRRDRLLPVLLFLACFGAYVGNGDFLHGSDQEGNMLFSVNLLKRHSFSLTLPDAPASFHWRLKEPGEDARRVAFDEELYEQGRLTPTAYPYYLATTRHPGTYVNTFGIGAALTGLPVYALLDLFTDVESDRWWWWHGGALTASLLTAATALLIFLAARRFVAPLPALLVALSFGLGSCAWPVSSQALWQHPANSFFLALGAFFLLASPERRRCAAYCGAALGMAVLCRPPSAVAVVCVGVWLAWADRRRLPAYVAGGLPFAAVLLAYNTWWFGSPFEFGQTMASRAIALLTTGSEDVWSGPLWESLPGLFVSPQRGLVFYSPVLLFGIAGAVFAWKQERYRPLIPLQISALLLIVAAARWYDWGGGSTWGYRSIVDAIPFLALSMIPLIERVAASPRLLALFGAALLWSATVQFVGAWSYNIVGWLKQWQEHADPDRASLWQWTRPQIVWHMANFESQRAGKQSAMRQYVRRATPILQPPPE